MASDDDKNTKVKIFRSLAEVERTYLPTLLESRDRGEGHILVDKTTEITRNALRKHVRGTPKN